MPLPEGSFDPFQPSRELHRGAITSVFAASKSGDQRPAYVLKVCRPPVDVVGQSGAARAVERFLARAELQRSWTEQPKLAALISPIHASGSTDGASIGELPEGSPTHPPGAYLVTELAAIGSVAHVVRIGAEVDHASLQAIAGRLATALAELKQHASRGHGALRPSNVLLTLPAAGGAAPVADGAAAGSLSQAQVRLEDPALAYDGDEAEHRDLRGFAEIVHLLVVGKPFQGGWTTGSQKRWSALGPSGAAWRKFVETMLDPTSHTEGPKIAGVGIEDLPRTVERLGKASKLRRNGLIAASIVLVLALGGGGYAYKLQMDRAAGNVVQRWNVDPQAAENWRELCNQYQAWFSLFLQRLDTERPSDGVIQAAMDSLGEAGGAGAPRIASRRDLYRLDSQLQVMVLALDNERVRAAGLDPDARSDPWSIAGVSVDRDLGQLALQPPERAKHDSSIERTERLLALTSAVRDGLASWKGPDVLREAAAEFNQLGWTKAGGYLTDLCSQFSTEQTSLSADVARNLDAVVAVKPTVDQIRARWRAVQGFNEQIVACDDPVMARFAPAAAAMVTNAGGPGQTTGRASDLRSLNEQLAKVETLARDLAAFAQTGWPRTDTDSLRESKEYATLLADAEVDAEQLRSFVALCAQHPTLDPMLDPRRTWTSPASLAAIDAIVEQVGKEPLPVSPERFGRDRLEAMRRDAEAIGAKTVIWNRRNQARIEGETARLDGSLTGFLSEIEQHRDRRLTEIATAAAALRDRLKQETSVTASDSLNAAWRTVRDALIASTPDEAFPRLEASAATLRQSLQRLDAAVPPAIDVQSLPPGAPWAEAMAAESRSQRERAIEKLIEPLVRGGPDAIDSASDLIENAPAASAAYAEWLSGARQTAQRADALERALRAGYGSEEPIETLADAQTPVALARAIGERLDGLGGASGALRELTSRVDALRATETQGDPQPLLSAVGPGGTPPQPEIVLASWRRLATIDPPWPRSVNDLDSFVAARSIVAARVNAVDQGPRRSTLSQQLLQQQPARMFSSLCDGLGSPQTLRQALERLPQLELDAAGLSPRTRFNAAVLASSTQLESAGKPKDPQTAELAKQVLASLESVGLSGDVRASGVITRVREIADWQPPKVELIDPKTLGPAKLAGWSATEDPETGRLTFRRDGQGPALAIEFDRVEADESLDTEACYISRHEVSLGTAVLLLAGQSANQLPENFPAPQPEGKVWSGSRGWRIDDTPSGRKLSPSKGWLFIDSNIDEKHPAYVPEYLAPGFYWQISEARGGEPSLDHPLQRVSFASAVYLSRLANCRLPSSAEWLAAYRSLVPASGRNGPWNLRDATFNAQTDHMQRMRDLPDVKTRTSFQWPSVGGVFAEPSKLAEGKPVPGAAANDGTLYFAKVNAPFGEPPHLVGNVAEFAFDDPVAIEQLPAGDLTAAIKLYYRFGEQIKIVGGSALSPSQVPFDAPQPLNDEQILYAEEGFADVGLRLAFSAKGTAARQEPLARKLARALGDDAFLLNP